MYTEVKIACNGDNYFQNEKMKLLANEQQKCGKVKHELRVTSYEFKSTSYEFKFTS